MSLNFQNNSSNINPFWWNLYPCVTNLPFNIYMRLNERWRQLPAHGMAPSCCHIRASSLFCLKVAVMSCFLGSLLNKGRRPLRGSDPGAASSEAEATAAFTELALLQVSAEAKAATVSSPSGTLKSFGEGLGVAESAEPALLPDGVCFSSRASPQEPDTERADPLRAPFSLSMLCLCAGWCLIFGLSLLCLVFSPPSLALPAALWRRGVDGDWPASLSITLSI